jgi:cyclophilin family peptidyl-prolyl cis-trans isomerase
VLSHNKFLDHFNTSTPSKHPVFGKVVEGMSTIEAIEASPTGPGDRPVEPVIMQSIKIVID